MEPPEFTSKALAVMAAAALMAMACVVWLMTTPALDVKDVGRLPASSDLSAFKLLR
ncbi:MAG: hypothetical protein ACXU85_24360 [Xanthobacteraceae bacterium]